MTASAPPSPSSYRSAWLMLLVLISAFAMSQAFRTAAAVMAAPLQQAFGLTPRQLGFFAGAFHFAFGGLQLFMGTGIDVYGTRRTVLAVFPLAILGPVVTATVDGFTGLIVGQALTGIGCAPAFLACTVFISRRFPSDRYASVNGAALGIGSVGLLLTGTPLAWVIQAWGWRAGYLAMAACAALAWLAILLLVREEPPAHPGGRPSMLAALRGYGELFRLPHTWGIIGLAVFTYASFLSLRGLWLGPMLIDRHGFSLVAAGHVALAISVLGMVAPALFGRFDPGDARRRRWLLGYTLGCAALFLLLALPLGAGPDVTLSLAVGFVSGYMVMQYADVRAAYPAAMTGRAMALFTMAMFMGVALMQSFTGWAASAAPALSTETYAVVMGAIGGMLVLGAALFRFLPQPPRRTP
ncbi:MAG TPA: MFS transporter [Aquabacterium sp.]|nr:MFS transporter [Aquabacterium sp.]